jgi:deoxycytidylate deaminase
MSAGNKVRQKMDLDALALWAVSKIAVGRGEDGKPLSKKVHILNSLKHPDEVNSLRKVYGSGFFLIGVYSSHQKRKKYLIDDKGLAADEADALIKRDSQESEPHGQKTTDTFHLADFFIDSDSDKMKSELWRFLDLLFGDPFITPTSHEYSMFLAHSAALRSGDLSRQVGAVIALQTGEVVATGANDVPKAGGGLYWPEPDEQRDHKKGFDSNAQKKKDLADNIAALIESGLKGDGIAIPAGAIKSRIETYLRNSDLADITEYGRAVHAEMEALLCCARIGINPRHAILFTTTFPCHNCAKHIVDAGIYKVFFIEPYPKSKALELHDDAVTVEEKDAKGENNTTKKVLFVPFMGVGPRRFFDLFSMSLGDGNPIKRKSADKINKAHWDRTSAAPRLTMMPTSYIQREKLWLEKLPELIKNARQAAK